VTEPIDPPARLPDHFLDRILVDRPRCGGLAPAALGEGGGQSRRGAEADREHARPLGLEVSLQFT
jgi:hypothetical protein